MPDYTKYGPEAYSAEELDALIAGGQLPANYGQQTPQPTTSGSFTPDELRRFAALGWTTEGSMVRNQQGQLQTQGAIFTALNPQPTPPTVTPPGTSAYGPGAAQPGSSSILNYAPIIGGYFRAQTGSETQMDAANRVAQLFGSMMQSTTEVQQAMFGYGQEVTEPYREAAAEQIPTLEEYAYSTAPTAEFTQETQQGTEDIRNLGAAGGTLYSGQTGKQMSDMYMGALDRDYNRRYGAQLGIGNIGGGAAGEAAGLAAQTGADIGDIYMGTAGTMGDIISSQAQAQAAATAGKEGAVAEGLQTLGTIWALA